MQRRYRVGDTELHDDADPDRDLVGRQYFLALDGQIALAYVHQHDFHPGLAHEPPAERHGHLVATRRQHLDRHTILVHQAAMGIFYDNFVESHNHTLRFQSKVGAACVPPCNGLVAVDDAENEFSDDAFQSRVQCM